MTQIRIGDRGEELVALLWRFGGLTARQYELLGSEPNQAAKAKGSTSKGNPYGRRGKLGANEHLIRAWVDEGLADHEIADNMSVKVEAVAAFKKRRGIVRKRPESVGAVA